MNATAEAPASTDVNLDEWSDKYQHTLDNAPEAGTILRAPGGEECRLDLELTAGKPPFVYGRAYVPSIAGQELGWFLQPVSCQNAFGLKCILLPKAREDLLRKKGLKSPTLSVKALRLVRWSQTKNSVLCEVAEF